LRLSTSVSIRKSKRLSHAGALVPLWRAGNGQLPIQLDKNAAATLAQLYILRIFCIAAVQIAGSGLGMIHEIFKLTASNGRPCVSTS